MQRPRDRVKVLITPLEQLGELLVSRKKILERIGRDIASSVG